MQSDKYWALRALQREQEAYDSTTDVIHHLHAIYFDATARLADMAKYIFDNFAKSAAGMIDPDKARALLSTAETAEVLAKLKQQYADTGSPEALAKLNAPAYAYRISRAQAMRRAIDAETQSLAEKSLETGAPHLAKTYDAAYYKTLYDRAKEPEGIPASPSVPAGKPGATASITGSAFDSLSDRTIQQALENRWHGANYSERVWANTHTVAKEAGRIIDAGVAAGTSVQNMTAELKDLMGVAWYAAERLIRTEVSRMHNDATLRGYKASGVEWYTWLGTLDARTCELCGALDGQHFRLSEAVTGKTLPPRHPNCRCTTIAYYPGEASGTTRIARDPKTGRNYKVPAGMTYEAWRKVIAEKYGDDALEKAQQRYRNLKADSAQQQAMRKLLGGKVPSKIADFQNLKYNEPKKWRYVRLDFERRLSLKKNPALALPGAEKAIADDSKFNKYIFNPGNKSGYAKGVAFESRLGYNFTNWKDLKAEILKSAPKYPSRMVRGDKFGKRYEQKIVLYGSKSMPANVVVGWNVKDEIPNMTTCYIKEVE